MGICKAATLMGGVTMTSLSFTAYARVLAKVHATTREPANEPASRRPDRRFVRPLAEDPRADAGRERQRLVAETSQPTRLP